VNRGRHRLQRLPIVRRPGISVPSVVGRARSDLGPLVLTTLVVGLAALLACAIPRLVTETGDDAVRYAVREAGPAAQVAISRPFSENPYEPRTVHLGLAESTGDLAASLDAELAPPLADVLAAPTTTAVTSALHVTSPAGDLAIPMLRMAHVWDGGPPALTWLEGGPAGAAFTTDDLADWVEGSVLPVEVALSEAVADGLQASVGDRISTRNDNRSVFIDVVVSGIFRAEDPNDPVWSVPGLLEPQVVGTALTSQTQVTGLLSDESLPTAVLAMPSGTTTRTITFAPEVDALREDNATQIAAEVAGLKSAAQDDVSYGTPPPAAQTDLDAILLDTAGRFRAATAQASVLLAGVLTVALLTLLVAAALLVRRRAAVLATHRARGATLSGIAAELATESTLVAAAGCTLGAALADLLVPGPLPWPWLVPVAVVAVLGTPVLGTRAAILGVGGRRVAANRRERSMVDKDRHAARVAVEAATVLAAAGALAALVRRGVTGAGTDVGADPLLALAPTLGALAGAVLLLRLVPPLLRWAVTATTRWRRATPVLAAARAQASAGAVLPFLALTISTALIVFGGAFVATVSDGELDASWSSVGADVLVVSDPDAALTEIAAALQERDDVSAAVTGRLDAHVELFGHWGGRLVRLVALPAAAFEQLLATTPLPDAPGLGELAGAGSGTAPPVLLSADLRAEDDEGLVLLWDGVQVDVGVVGTAPVLLTSGEDTVVVDAEALAEASGTAVDPDRIWLVGSGAEAAVVSTPALDGATVSTRSDWLATHRAAPLTIGVERLAWAAAVVLAVLAVLVVVLASSTSAPHRIRTLATLRTLGMDGRAVRAVTAGELLPGVLVASLGGVGLGAVLATLATGPLALRLVTGQSADPRTVLPAWVVVPPVLVLGTVAVLVLVESSIRRRERLGQVLRVGGP
jgi:putative ABC transport system permease protein